MHALPPSDAWMPRSPGAARNAPLPPVPQNSPQALEGMEHPYAASGAPGPHGSNQHPCHGPALAAPAAGGAHLTRGPVQAPWAALAPAGHPTSPLAQLPPAWFNCPPPPAPANGHVAVAPKTGPAEPYSAGSFLGLSQMSAPFHAAERPRSTSKTRRASDCGQPTSPEPQERRSQSKRRKVRPQ